MKNPKNKSSANIVTTLSNFIGWLLLVIGLLLYIVPLFFSVTGHYSGLLAFALIFIGISLLKYRKDQMDK